MQMTVGALRKAIELVEDDVKIRILDNDGDELNDISEIVYAKRLDATATADKDERVDIRLE